MKSRTFALLTISVVMLAGACSSGGGGSNTTPPATITGQSSPPAGAGGSVSITLVDFSFQPSTVTASTAQAIILKNTGAALHNFSIEGTPIDTDVPAGQTVTLQPPGPSFQPGTYTFFCKYHRAQGMTGTLTATSG